MNRSIVLGIFILSGAAGLIFEVVWARQLVLVFGNTTQAVSAILTGFFGGMALGSWYGGKFADRVDRPLRLYGLMEIVLVGVVILTPLSFRLINEVYRSAFDGFTASPLSLALVRLFLALCALGPATVLMGATLPTLTRYLSRTADNLSSAFAGLYVANLMGAVAGAIVAGLILIELFGLAGALRFGAGCSALAGLVALIVDRRSAANLGTASLLPTAESVSFLQQHATSPRLALAVAYVSGLTSLGCQVLWIRLISSGSGNSTYVFTAILTVFLTGLALGAVEFKRIRPRLKRVVELLAAAQIAVGILIVLGMAGMLWLDTIPQSFLWKSILVVLPTTFLMGLSFPASASLLGDEEARVGARSGRLLAANTAGAITGTLLIPFAIIPVAGSAVALAIVALISISAGTLIATKGLDATSRARGPLITFGGLAAAGAAIALASGSVFVDPSLERITRRGAIVARHAEDEIASVQSGDLRGKKLLWVTGTAMTALTVDAKLMPILPLILRPKSKTLLAVAFGMGSAYRTALAAGLKTDAVELVPSVMGMFDTFYGDASAVRANGNGRVIIADGRNYVELTDRTYDIIVVDPPPPVESSGVSIISSLEFYLASRTRLAPGGVMMQWVPFGPSLSEFKDHVRTFNNAFPHVIVAAGPGQNGFFMLGSAAPLEIDPDIARQILSRPGLLADISSAFDSPESTVEGWLQKIQSLVRLSGAQVGQFAGSGKLITDDRPLPEYFLLRFAFEPPPQQLTLDAVRPMKTALR